MIFGAIIEMFSHVRFAPCAAPLTNLAHDAAVSPFEVVHVSAHSATRRLRGSR